MNAVFSAAAPTRWTAQRQGYRLVLRASPKLGAATGINVEVTTDDGAVASGFDIGAAGAMMDRAQADNIAAYTLGVNAGGGRQSNFAAGSDGSKPLLPDYNAAFAKIDSEVEIFNLMILPRAEGQTDGDRAGIWGAASAFCAKERAILFVDPLGTWDTLDKAVAGADAVKVGIDTRNSVIYWPRVKASNALFPKGKTLDPSGSMAGLYARTDSRFGTWRAPAGIEATLTGVVGLDALMSDAENGLINPKALNAIRLFPSGITSWGARTMVGADDTGNVDDKYINVRRMMLFIENSLYRGLRFAVFKNNAEPLWASIRLAAGAFMNGLMIQGAFASNTKSSAYYVLCDSTTTSPDDINLGIVNVLVGFAPNKPAEFLNLIVTQIAGQVQV
jgi:phage tail sheath protein FI